MNSVRVRCYLTPLLALSVALPAIAQQSTAPAAEKPKEEKDKVLELSPFVVKTSKDAGYFAENTLMGSRLNTKVSDLAASITVVTKQQLEDTGALDINDVFRYEANTEGASTYTPVALNRSNLTDNIGGYSGDDGSAFGIATANRVRGLGRVDTSQNNYPTISRLAFDSYNTNSVEINRGPNSMLFGTGSPAGIINQSAATAVLGQQHTQVQLRGGSFDAWRAHFNTNIPVGDSFALYFAGLYDSRGFQRKPSSDVYRRQYGAFTWRPFQKTTITGSYEHYDNHNNRPNYLPPQDRVTPWLNAGRPGFNPSTQIFTFANGTTTRPYLNSTLDARYIAGVTPSNDAALTTVPTATSPNAFYIPGLAFLAGRQTIYYDNGQEVGFWVPNGSSGGGTFGTTVNGVVGALPAAANQTQAQRVIVASRLVLTNSDPTPVPPASTGATGYGTWILPHITNQSIYDWTKYNISGNNYGDQSARTWNVELQQSILPNLYFSAGWFRQEFDEFTHYGLGQANQAPRLYVDVNTHNLDGTPNPYFGAPFVFDSQADTFYLPETNDNYRAMLSYELDLSNNSHKWLSMLGKHRFFGFYSRQDQWKNNLRYRLSYQGGNGRFLPNTTTNPPNNYSWAGNAASIQRIFYVGDGGSNGTVSRGLTPVGEPGYGGPTHSSLRFYNWNSGAWDNTQMDYDMNLFYAGANYGVATRRTDSKRFTWQGYMWNERVIPTLGWVKDKVTLAAYDGRDANNVTLTTPTTYANGEGILGLWDHLGAPRTFSGTTRTMGVVTRPFIGWANIDRRANDGNVFFDFIRNLGFHYNKSDNFNPPAGIQVDFFNRPLAPPSGEGKDYGVQIAMFDNKLVARLNWYEATNENALSNGANTVVGRLQRIDTTAAKRWAETVVRMRSGQDPATDLEFYNNTLHPLSQTQQDGIRDLQWGAFEFKDYNWPNYGSATVNSTESNLSKGKELQLTYNPNLAWTLKWTVGQQESSYSKVGPEVSEWIDYRKPQWQALKATDFPNVITKANGNRLYVGDFWNGYGFTQGAAFDDANSNSAGAINTPATTYTSIVESVLFPVIAQQNTKASNLREWSTTVLSSYRFTKGMLKGLVVGGQYNWQDKAVAGYQSLLDPATYARPNASTANIVFPDLTKPIYTPAIDSLDLFASYSRKIFSDKVNMKIQVNVRDVMEDGGLQAVVFNQDGTPAQYRIKDPRTWFVTTTFDF
ncbi:MAG TPA: TonB-dependent receptor plug domain-containing protein [Lacunisphaera sp.]|nr:TonB-dependent receptor plug domain-containing protein [Lacunisphaera sp.]